MQNAKHCFPTVFIYIEVAFKCSGQLQLKLYFSILIENCIYKNFSIYYVREKFVKHKGFRFATVLQFFTFNFQLARGQSHCRDCPLAFGDILIKITYLPEV